MTLSSICDHLEFVCKQHERDEHGGQRCCRLRLGMIIEICHKLDANSLGNALEKIVKEMEYSLGECTSHKKFLTKRK